MLKKILIPILCLYQVVYSEVTFQKISGEPDLIASFNKGELQNILLKCKDIAIKIYDYQGEYSIGIDQGVKKGISYTLTQNGKHCYVTKDDPNRITIRIRKANLGRCLGGGLRFFLDKTNTFVEGYIGYR